MTAATLSPNSNKFRLARGAQPLILLPVRVNDRGPFDFILDTGAGTSLLSSELAKQLETKVIGSKEGQSAGGKVSVSAGQSRIACGRGNEITRCRCWRCRSCPNRQDRRRENRRRSRLQFSPQLQSRDRLSGRNPHPLLDMLEVPPAPTSTKKPPVILSRIAETPLVE